MGSLNFNPFGGNWFKKPKTPFQLINPNCLPDSFKPKPPNFSSISSSAFDSSSGTGKPIEKSDKIEPGYYKKLLKQYLEEEATRPDYRHHPVVDQIMKEQEEPVFDKEKKPTQEELEENEKWWSEFRGNPVVQFLEQAEEIAGKLHEAEMQENNKPYHKEDKKIWDSIANVIGLDGRPMPRKSFDDQIAYVKFWDFMKEHLFGLWGFKNRPYPSGRPIDVAQCIGTKALENRYYDFTMRSGGFYYKDRLGRTRGPMELIQLKTAWGAGIIDKNTFVWAEDMDEWAPIGMIYGMERAVARWDARFAAAATAFFHNIQRGKAPWSPLKGHKNLTYKQAQQEAYESKKRDLAVLEANNGIWPGVRIPSHSLFLWASGTELTNILEADHMPNKFISRELRKQLQKAIPGLRPWEVLSVEQAMDRITYNSEWYREPLGTFMTSAPYYLDLYGHTEHALEFLWYCRRKKTVDLLNQVRNFPRVTKLLGKIYADSIRTTLRLKKKFYRDKYDKEMQEWEDILSIKKK